MVGRRIHDFPKYMTVDGDRGGFKVTNPLSGKSKRFSKEDEEKARDLAIRLGELVRREQLQRALDDGLPSVSRLVQRWKAEEMQFHPWDPGTRDNYNSWFKRIDNELGQMVVRSVTALQLHNWLTTFCTNADMWNHYRYALVLLWKFAVLQQMCKVNVAEQVAFRSTSKKLEMNRKSRRRLDIAGYRAIHSLGEPWFQISMEQSLQSLLGREETCEIQHQHYRNGFLFVIREKVAGDSAKGFIRIPLTPDLLALQRRSRMLSNVPTTLPQTSVTFRAVALEAQGLSSSEIADRLGSSIKKIGQLLWWHRKHVATKEKVAIISPHLVWRRPEKMSQRVLNCRRQAGRHWTYVEPDYLTREFQRLRDLAGVDADRPPNERTTYHEIRSLGARIMEAQGIKRMAIQTLLAHSKPSTTEIYLQHGAAALTEADFELTCEPLAYDRMLTTDPAALEAIEFEVDWMQQDE